MTQVTNFELVGDFMQSFAQQVNHQPELVDKAVSDLRVDLIAEELEELQAAIEDDDIIEIADALTDLLYVVYGAGHTYGIDLDECFKEVHRSNMSKLGSDGKPIYREDGKVLKGPGFSEPDLGSVIF